MKRATLMVSILALAGLCRAQDVREVDFRADSSFARIIDGRQVTELFGVYLEEDQTQLWAQRAVDFGDGVFHFHRDVRIVEDGDTLTADEVRYNRHTKTGRAVGNVRLGDGEVVVMAPEGNFDLNANRADFAAGVRLVDSTSVLTSDTGSYWTEEKRAEFAGSVRLDSEETDVVADSLTYFRAENRSEAEGRVIAVHRSEELLTVILGEHIANDDSLGTRTAEGDVLVARLSVDSTGAAPDTLLIRADQVFSRQSDSTEHTVATGSVVVWSKDFSALSDSVFQVFDRDTDYNERRLFGDPIIWVGESQVSGDSMRIVGRESSIDSLQVFGTVYAVQEDTLLSRLQQVKGLGLAGLFESDSLRALQVTPNAEAIYFRPGDDDRLHGMFAVTADSIEFVFRGGQVDSVGVRSGVDGTYFPVDLMPDRTRLDGLLWRPNDRPDPQGLLARLRAALRRFNEPDLNH